MCTKPICLKDPLRYPRQTGLLPCGFCPECRSRYARGWAMRCVHEASLHEENSFVTLTYADEYLPELGTLVKRDLQLFLKRLRKMIAPKRVRHYAVGEYGEINHRPHYHLLLFGYRPAFGEVVPSPGDFPLYSSAELAALWKAGLSSVGDVSFASAQYLARYVMQYSDNVKRKKKFTCDPETGELVEIQREYSTMSKHPGLGAGWYDQFREEVVRHDSVVLDGVELLPPKYYDDRLRQADAVKWELMKLRRERKRLREGKTVTEQRRDRMAREVMLRSQLAELERNL